jgi:hypothetical protein
MGERRGVYRVLVRKSEGKRPGLGGRIILKWNFKKWVEETWTGLVWLRIAIDGGFLYTVYTVYGNEP